MVQEIIQISNTRKMDDIESWSSTQPGIINILPERNDNIFSLTFTCDFTNEIDKTTFLDELNNRVSNIKIENIPENLNEYIGAIQADNLIYITELSQTKTNIGTTFTDLFTDYAGRNFFVDLTGCNKIRYHVNANIPGGSGTQNLRIVDNATLTQVLMDIVITNGQNSGNVTIPVGFENFRGRIRIQVKSTSANDDPTYDRIILHALRPNRT